MKMNESNFIFNYDSYPIIPIKFKSGDRKTPVIEALLDSGGDFIVIPQPIASYLNLELTQSCDVDTAGGTTSLYQAEVDMIIGNKDQCNIYYKKQIHVSNRNDIPVLLGRNPLFEDYEITFKKQQHQLILKSLNMEPTRGYPPGF